MAEVRVGVRNLAKAHPKTHTCVCVCDWNFGKTHMCVRCACGRKSNVRMCVRARPKIVATHSLNFDNSRARCRSILIQNRNHNNNSLVPKIEICPKYLFCRKILKPAIVGRLFSLVLYFAKSG